jgi:hypothetical protein
MSHWHKARRWIGNILVALDLDQLANALLGGDPDETISSRVGKRVHDQPWAYWLCRLFHLFDRNHCDKSIERDRGDREVIR